MLDVWTDIPSLNNMAKERLGYPTQKPRVLLERILASSSQEGDLVLDPFCGCGTTLHAAEKLNRRWIGIDIARFATGLVRNRLLSNFDIDPSDVRVLGIPETPEDARQLAEQDKFEFEKWACGHVGAEGLFHAPGTKGADGGVDGVLKFWPLQWGKKARQDRPEFAIVQVKGGAVTPDAVRALDNTMKRFEAKAGVIVCFRDRMQTVEDMLRGNRPNLPNLLKQAS